MKRAAKKKVEPELSASAVALRGLFRSFGKLAGQAADGRPLLRGLRVAHDPTAERIVVVHGATRVEFVFGAAGGDPPCAQVECRRMDSMGATEKETIASFQFNEKGDVVQSSVAELVNENIAQTNGAWSIVASVVWSAMHGPG